MSDMLIKNGRICLASGEIDKDIYIKDGKVDSIGNGHKTADKVIDASGKLIIPGLIDSHTHMEFPFMSEITADDFYHGTKAALGGGVTTIVDFITPLNGENPFKAYERYRELADPKVVSDYGLHCILRDAKPDTLNSVKTLIENGVVSFKVFMAYKNELLLDDESLYDAIKEISKYNGVTAIHAENGRNRQL